MTWRSPPGGMTGDFMGCWVYGNCVECSNKERGVVTKFEHGGVYKGSGWVNGIIFGTIELVLSIEIAIFKSINIFETSMIKVFVFHDGLSVPWELRAINDTMTWSMFLADLAEITWTVWFLMRTAVAREADWFCSSWCYWLLEAALTGISISLASAPGNMIINIAKLTDATFQGFLFSGFLNLGLFDF